MIVYNVTEERQMPNGTIQTIIHESMEVPDGQDDVWQALDEAYREGVDSI